MKNAPRNQILFGSVKFWRWDANWNDYILKKFLRTRLNIVINFIIDKKVYGILLQIHRRTRRVMDIERA